MEKKMTFAQLIKKDEDKDFHIAIGYYVELDHALAGTFPIISIRSRDMVMTTDRELLEEIWKTLTPRRAKLSTQLVYVNCKTGIAYPIFGNEEYHLNDVLPFQMLTRERYNQLMQEKDPAFEWSPGLVGNDMSHEEFEETLRLARRNEL